MTTVPGPALQSLPAVIFQFSSHQLTLLNKELPLYPGLTAAKLSRILRAGWRKLVPEEFHPVVTRLAVLLEAEGHTTAEFPVYWMGGAVWLRIFAASAMDRGQRKIIGLAQDVTSQRQSPPDADRSGQALGEHSSEETDDSWRNLRHDINGSLTSILMNCELLLESAKDPLARRRIESMLAEALRIDQSLQQYRRH